MARLSIVLFLVQIALAVAALISCLSTEEDEIKSLPRIGWILIILFFPLIGSLAWFIAGRVSKRPRTGWGLTGGGTGRQQPRQVAPDDDPEFLRSLRPKPEKRDDEPTG